MYSKQTWVDNSTPLSAARMNNMENGIAAATQYLGSGAAFPTAGLGAGDVFLRTDVGPAPGTLFTYDGSAWYTLNTGPAAGDTWSAEYRNGTAQTIPNASDTAMLFDTAVTTSAIVSKASNGVFTINQAGLYGISATARYSGTGQGEFFMSILQGTPPSTNVLAASGNGNVAASQTPHVCIAGHVFTVGTTFFINLFQNSGASLATTPGTGMNSIQIVRIR